MNHGGNYGDGARLIRHTALLLGGLVRPSDIVSDWFPTYEIAAMILHKMADCGLAAMRPPGTMPGRWEPAFLMLPPKRIFRRRRIPRTPADL